MAQAKLQRSRSWLSEDGTVHHWRQPHRKVRQRDGWYRKRNPRETFEPQSKFRLLNVAFCFFSTFRNNYINYTFTYFYSMFYGKTYLLFLRNLHKIIYFLRFYNITCKTISVYCLSYTPIRHFLSFFLFIINQLHLQGVAVK